MKRHLSPALVISLIALFVALGGTGYAVTKLPKNSVGASQIKKNSITSAKVKDGSLLSADFGAGQLPRGATGPQGEPGPFPSGNLPSGKTVRGNWAVATYSSSGTGSHYGFSSISYGFQLASAPTPHFIADGSSPPAECPGSATDPQAAAGHLCVYEAIGNHDPGAISIFNPATGAAGQNRWGAGIILSSITATSDSGYGTWAVTAP